MGGLRMKNIRFILLALMLVATLLLSSCSALNFSNKFDMEINENGELIVKYADGTEENLGVVVGSDGVDGADGKDGVDGKDGKDGADGKDGESIIEDGDVIVNNYEVTVNGEPGGELSEGIKKGLLGAVSIVCANVGSGSGVIYRMDKSQGDALIITNYHVLYDEKSGAIAKDIGVYLYGSEIQTMKIPAEYVGGSMNYDIAVLSVENSSLIRDCELAPVTVADSEKIFAGDGVIAIGNAKNNGTSVTCGAVSVPTEYLMLESSDKSGEIKFRVIRVDAPVNPGNSGGGLYNSRGELIGIVNAKNIENNVDNIGYAIPSNLAITVADKIIETCLGKEEKSIYRCTVGVTVEITEAHLVYDEQSGNMRSEETIKVKETVTGSLADGVLIAGDIVKSVAVGEERVSVTKLHHISDTILKADVGDKITFEVVRDGEEITVEVTTRSKDVAVVK